MTLLAYLGALGPRALYLLFIWLLSAAGGAWLAERKGYGERLGLMFGMLLSLPGFVVVLFLPGRPGSKWKLDGPLPKRKRHPASGSPAAAPAEGPPAVIEEPPEEPPPAG